MKKIAHELTESLRQNISIDYSVRDNVRAKLRLMVKRILTSTNTRYIGRKRLLSWYWNRRKH